MNEPRYVYVVEAGCYSSRGVIGVYANPDAAMIANPIPTTATNRIRSGGWQPYEGAEPGTMWSNGYDWENHQDITRYELES